MTGRERLDELDRMFFDRELASWRGTAPLGRVSVPARFLVELIAEYDRLKCALSSGEKIIREV